MEKNNDFLGTEPVKKLLLKLAIPTIAAQIINMLYNIVDRIYIGHIPKVGNLALTGVGICMPLIMIVSAFAMLIAAGGAPRASIFMGQGDNEKAEEVMANCFSLQIIVSIIITFILFLFNRTFLMSFGASENTIEYAVEYMNIYAIGTLFVQLTLGMNEYITAQGFASTGMKTVLIGALLNIILDPIFIFGLNMGVKGAALASVISQGVSCIWVMRFLFGKKSILKIRRKNLKIKSKTVMPCIGLGMSRFIMQSTESLIAVCFNASLLKYGGDIAVGAMTILTSVMQFALLPLNGLAQGAQPITSYNYGACNTQRVKEIFKVLLKYSFIYSMVFWSLVMVFPKVFAGIFTPDISLLNYSAKMLRIYCFSLGLFGIQIACQMTFVAIGYAKSSIIVAVMRKIVLLIPLIYIMPKFMTNKALAVYMAEPVADFFSVCFAATLFYKQFKKAIETMEDKKSEIRKLKEKTIR